MTVIHLKKKDIVKSSVKGVAVEFDHEKSASILGIPETMGSEVVEEAAVEGESGSGEKFYDAEDKDQSSPEVNEEIPAAAEFERKRANRFHADLEKAKAENARLLALLHQAQSKPHP
ncbi:hypothetical protein Dimus_025034 [Dionaea muscipula]